MKPIKGLPLGALASAWRTQAEELRPFAPSAAAAFEEAAEELERAVAEAGNVMLSLAEASRESGLSSDHLGRLVRQGVIPNAGRKHAPRIRRQDLPRKPSRVATRPRALYDPVADARSLAGRRRED